MKRHEFEFPFAGSVLATAARECRDHHERRIAHYTAEYDKAMAEMHATGVEVKVRPEARGGAYAYNSTNLSTRRQLGNVEVDVDHKLMERIDLCAAKMEEHERQRDEFARWCLAFDKHPEETYRLNIDDMNHFWL